MHVPGPHLDEAPLGVPGAVQGRSDASKRPRSCSQLPRPTRRRPRRRIVPTQMGPGAGLVSMADSSLRSTVGRGPYAVVALQEAVAVVVGLEAVEVAWMRRSSERLGDQAVELTGDLEVARQPGEGRPRAACAPPQRGLHAPAIRRDRSLVMFVRAPAQTSTWSAVARLAVSMMMLAVAWPRLATPTHLQPVMPGIITSAAPPRGDEQRQARPRCAVGNLHGVAGRSRVTPTSSAMSVRRL